MSEKDPQNFDDPPLLIRIRDAIVEAVRNQVKKAIEFLKKEE